MFDLFFVDDLRMALFLCFLCFLAILAQGFCSLKTRHRQSSPCTCNTNHGLFIVATRSGLCLILFLTLCVSYHIQHNDFFGAMAIECIVLAGFGVSFTPLPTISDTCACAEAGGIPANHCTVAHEAARPQHSSFAGGGACSLPWSWLLGDSGMFADFASICADRNPGLVGYTWACLLSGASYTTHPSGASKKQRTSSIYPSVAENAMGFRHGHSAFSGL